MGAMGSKDIFNLRVGKVKIIANGGGEATGDHRRSPLF